MPNRSALVKQIAARYPQAFGKPDETLDARRRLLIPIICKECNKLDNDQWALLNRMDRSDEDPKIGRLAADILVWLPTKEHVDVLSSSGAMWEEHPPITDTEWKFESPDKWPSWDNQSLPTEGTTHKYNGGGHDTGICDDCGQIRGSEVHAIPESKVNHTYDGGEQDTGTCDICGQGRNSLLHNPVLEPPVVPEPVPNETLTHLQTKIDEQTVLIKEILAKVNTATAAVERAVPIIERVAKMFGG